MLADALAPYIRAFGQHAESELRFAAALALTRTAQRAQKAVTEKLPTIFDRPTPTTMRSIRITMTRKSTPLAEMRSSVWIRDEAPKGTAPARYLQAEIEGGTRRDKRSERALIAAGVMPPGTQTVPGDGAELDAYGNIPGGQIVRILSRLGAFGEQGYSANAGEKTKRALKRKRLAHAQTGTDYFLGRDRWGESALAVYRLVAKGHVEPVLFFARRRPVYKARFDFAQLVESAAAAAIGAEIAAAMREAHSAGPSHHPHPARE